MNGHFTTEIGRLRTEEMVNRAARYRELDRGRRAAARAHGDADRSDGSSRLFRYLYVKALRVAALSVLFLALGATAAYASPTGPGNDPGPILRESVDVTQVPAADGGTSPLFWAMVSVGIACAGAALLLAWTRRFQRVA